MDQLKIGKFIAACRKKENLTQMQLAEKLGITDRAVSKWETGKAMPDSAVMLELCAILKITVNDLLSGEVVTMENYNQEMEKKLLELVKEKEDKDKMLLKAEIIVGIVAFIPLLLATIFVAYNQNIEEWKRGVIVLASIVPFLISVPFLIKIEQKAGYYKCAECGHRYVPTFKSVLMAPHMGMTRKMTCPACGKRSWQKKVLTKE
ncbi:MAG: helix-turn-helix transcriptional regulator [Oscillospiraceae bacterium]|nr:helix-turn-helix transcriptional regulator [Oscillospiraceae bacterium]